MRKILQSAVNGLADFIAGLGNLSTKTIGTAAGNVSALDAIDISAGWPA